MSLIWQINGDDIDVMDKMQFHAFFDAILNWNFRFENGDDNNDDTDRKEIEKIFQINDK